GRRSAAGRGERAGDVVGAQSLRRPARCPRCGRALGPALRRGRRRDEGAPRPRPAQGDAMSQVPLTQQVALIAGATSDIGRAIALGLARAGAQLCLLGRDTRALDALAATAGELTNKVFAYPMDLTCDASVRETIARLGCDVGAVDILVLSAGVFAMGVHER